MMTSRLPKSLDKNPAKILTAIQRLFFLLMTSCMISSQAAYAQESSKSALPEYFITCDPDSFAFINANPQIDHFIPVTISYQNKTWTDTRMRIRGDGTRKLPKKSYKIQFDGEPFANGRGTLNLNAEYEDRSYIHAIVSSRLMRESGQHCFVAEPVRVFLNGDFLGLYIAIENMDEQFLEARNLDKDGNLYKATLDGACLSMLDDVNFHWEKKTGANDGREDLQTLIDQINSVPNVDFRTFLQSAFDYQGLINIIAMNMLVANGSTYYHNYYMYHDLNRSGKWMMLPWDMDKTLRQYGIGYAYHRTSGNWTPDNPLVERALLDEQVFADVEARIDALAASIFNPGFVNPIIDSLETVLAASVEQDAGDNIVDKAFWQNQLAAEKQFIAQRKNALKAQFNTWPRPFRAYPAPDDFIGQATLRWSPSLDLDGDEVTYTVEYGPKNSLLPAETTVISGVRDTSLTVAPPAGTWFWQVWATDGVNVTAGFDTWNTFTVKSGSALPAVITNCLTLTESNSPYFSTGDVVVETGACLHLEAGAEFRLSPGANLNVRGKFSAMGSENRPVRIRRDPFAAPESRWGGMIFDRVAEAVVLKHVEIENTSNGDDASRRPAALNAIESNVEVQSVIFKNSNQSIFVQGGELIVDACRFEALKSERCVEIVGAKTKIENSIFTNINAENVVSLSGVTSAQVSNNQFFAIDGTALLLKENSQDAHLENNVFLNCSQAGISLDENSSATLLRNIISRSKIAVAARNGASATVEHLTTFETDTAFLAEKTLDGFSGGRITAKNSIFSQTKSEEFVHDAFSSIDQSWSLVESGIVSGEGNIFGDPFFLAPGDGNFALSANSPAVDSGDPQSPLDPDGTRADMGAVFFDQIKATAIVINEINYNAAAHFDTDDWVEFFNKSTQEIDLSGWVFRDSDDLHRFEFPLGIVLQPNEALALCQNLSAFRSLFPEIENVIGEMDFGLSGNGELLRLFDEAGRLVDSVRYDDALPWPTSADGGGATLALKQPDLDNALAQNWTASLQTGGTPGLPNDQAVALGEIVGAPEKFQLRQNYPNPFADRTRIVFSLPDEARVAVKIYNIRGQVVQTIEQGRLTHGEHSLTLDLSNKTLAAGLYFYTLHINEKMQAVKKLTILR